MKLNKNCYIISLFILLSCINNENKQLLEKIPSPGHTNNLTLYYTEPGVAFGPHTIMVYLSDNNAVEKEIFRTELNNDGASLSKENILVNWLSEKEFELILKGEQQKTTCIRFSIKEKMDVIHQECKEENKDN